MSEPETFADALAAARKMLDEDGWIDEITAPDEDGEPNDYAQRVVRVNDVRDALDRIEAAAKRERAITDVMLAVKDKPLPHPDPEHAPPLYPGNAAATRKALDKAECVLLVAARFAIDNAFTDAEARENLRDVDWDGALAEIDAALAAPPEPPSNAAAMRAVLERLDEHLHEDDYDEHLFFDLFDYDPKEEIRTALAAPARNCDRFEDGPDALFAYKDTLRDGEEVRVPWLLGGLFEPAKGGAE